MIGGDASDRDRRRSLRLEGYDYGGWGPCFVSIVVDKRLPLFGEVVDEEMRLTDAGEMVQSVWAALPQRFPAVHLDMFVVMPNHIHGIIVIDHSDTVTTSERATTRVAPTGAPDAGRRIALGDVVGAYKSLSTVEYTRGVAVHGWPRFRGRLWQPKLLRTHHPRRQIARTHPRLYPRQPRALANRSREPVRRSTLARRTIGDRGTGNHKGCPYREGSGPVGRGGGWIRPPRKRYDRVRHIATDFPCRGNPCGCPPRSPLRTG